MPDSSCSVEGCEKQSWQRGWCSMHYQRWRRHGSLADPGAREVSADGRKMMCRGCRQLKDVESFSARPEYRSGREGSCRSCVSLRRREREKTDPALRDRARAADRIRKSQARSLDPVSHREASLAYYKRNREELLSRRSQWRASNPDKVAAWNRAQRNRSDYSEKRRARWQALGGVLRERARERARRSSSLRRARKADASAVPFTSVQAAQRAAFYGDRCWMCGADGATHLDHVKPLAAGGPHMLSNLRPSCPPCNWRKNRLWLGPAWASSLKKSGPA